LAKRFNDQNEMALWSVLHRTLAQRNPAGFFRACAMRETTMRPDCGTITPFANRAGGSPDAQEYE
jgi:hypothetical protein